MRITRIQLSEAKGGSRDIDVEYGPNAGQIHFWVNQWKAHPAGRGSASHWKWHLKRLAPSGPYQVLFIALTEGSRCHGLMKLLWPKNARSPPSDQIVYVDYLEVAPENRPGPTRELKGAGAALQRLAILESHQQGFGGRIGLHSLPDADGFYQRLKMVSHGSDPGYQHLTYFEL